MATERVPSSGFEPPRPPIPSDLDIFPIEKLRPLARDLGGQLRRNVYSMAEFRDAKKDLKDKPGNQTVLFQADFQGKDYNYKVELEQPTSLHNNEPTIFSVERSWTELDLGEYGKIVIREKVRISNSKTKPEIFYSWERSDNPEETQTFMNNRRAEASIRSFVLT